MWRGRAWCCYRDNTSRFIFGDVKMFVTSCRSKPNTFIFLRTVNIRGHEHKKSWGFIRIPVSWHLLALTAMRGVPSWRRGRRRRRIKRVWGARGGEEGGMRGLPIWKPPPAAAYNYPAVTAIFNSTSLQDTWMLSSHQERLVYTPPSLEVGGVVRLEKVLTPPNCRTLR